VAGLATLRTDEWVAGIATGLNTARGRVTNVAVEHEVMMKDFLQWLDGTGGSPLDIIHRNRIRSILGIETKRTG
jgi:hypothetical protein